MKYNKKLNYKQNSNKLTLQEVLQLIAHKKGCNPILSGNGYSALCPAHDDKHSSLHITEAEDGTILICCYAGCKINEICDSIGIAVSALFPAKKRTGYRG